MALVQLIGLLLQPHQLTGGFLQALPRGSQFGFQYACPDTGGLFRVAQGIAIRGSLGELAPGFVQARAGVVQRLLQLAGPTQAEHSAEHHANQHATARGGGQLEIKL